MSSRSALARREVPPAEHHVVAPVAETRSPLHTAPTANDDEHTSGFSFYGDPLIGMAVASIILLVVFAALMMAS
jgi:hypothetical protein